MNGLWRLAGQYQKVFFNNRIDIEINKQVNSFNLVFRKNPEKLR